MKAYLQIMQVLSHIQGWIFVFVGLLIVYLLIKYRNHFVLKGIIDDTLKIKDPVSGQLKWSRTSIIMTTAWAVCLYSYLYDLWNNGFNETAFYFLGGVALGAKVTDAWSKKIDPTIVGPPTTEVTNTNIIDKKDNTDFTIKTETTKE